MAKTIERIMDAVYAVVMVLCKVFLIADICVTSYGVAGRYLRKYVSFLQDPAWGSEVVLTLMVYMAFFSAALAVRKGSHIRMTTLDVYLPKKLVQVLDLVGDLLVLGFALVMVIVGYSTASKISMIKYSTIPFLSQFWKYAAIPFSGIVIVLFSLEVIYKHVRALAGKEE